MTTVFAEKVRCAICGKKSKHMRIGSTNTFGGTPDLDTRRPEMMRSTINMWIQTCPSCGFCAPNKCDKVGNSSRIVRSRFYQRHLSDPAFPELANAFLCHSLLQESVGSYAGAGWSSVHAAWACDDAHSETSAQVRRRRAVALFQKARENGLRIADKTGAEEAIIADILRRTGQFEAALRICNDGLEKNPEQVVTDVLQFQKTLIGKLDGACHTIAEASAEDEWDDALPPMTEPKPGRVGCLVARRNSAALSRLCIQCVGLLGLAGARLSAVRFIGLVACERGLEDTRRV